MVIKLDTGMRVKAIVGDVSGPDVTRKASIFCAGLISGLKPSEIIETLAAPRKSVIDPRQDGAGRMTTARACGGRSLVADSPTCAQLQHS
jgi:hypothetical protein